MTKPAPAAPKAAAAPKAPAPQPAPVVETAASAFVLEDNIPVPEVTRKIGEPSAYPFEHMNVNQSFRVPVTIADTITDAAEREKAFKEEARRLTNRLTGAARRFCEKTGNENKKFTVRTVDDGQGVRCWRVADAEPATTAQG